MKSGARVLDLWVFWSFGPSQPRTSFSTSVLQGKIVLQSLRTSLDLSSGCMGAFSWKLEQQFSKPMICYSLLTIWPKRVIRSQTSTMIQKIFETSSSFLVFTRNSALGENLNFCFLRDFYQYWQNFHFGRRTEHQAINL